MRKNANPRLGALFSGAPPHKPMVEPWPQDAQKKPDYGPARGFPRPGPWFFAQRGRSGGV